MAKVEEIRGCGRGLTEYEALVASAATVLDAIPAAVYLCDHEGAVVRHNAKAAKLWGRTPSLSGSVERFCGSYRLFRLDGTPLPHAECPMAEAIFGGKSISNGEVVIERPDGARSVALVNIRALRGHRGEIQGAINCFQDITEKKEAEAEARRKTQDLEDFFENSAVGLHIVSGEGIIVRANNAELELLGYTENEYVGRHVAEFHVDAPVIGEILQRLASGEKLDRHPARLRAKDGSIKHVLITSNSRFEDGRFVATRCFTMDVTDLWEAEHALRESEGRLAATYEAATVGISEADAKGRLMRVNDALCKMLGRSREELLGMTFLDYTHEEDRDQDAKLYARQVAGELDSYSMRKRAITADGSIRYLDIHSSSVRDPSGQFRHGVRIVQDVTDAKRMEDRVRENEQHMRDLLQALPAAVYTTDAEGRITFFNKAAEDLAGRTPIVGDRWCVTWRLFKLDGTPLLHEACPMAVALRENRAVRGEEAIAERPDGSRVPFMPYPTPLRGADGRLTGAINMLVDISERKQAELRQKTLIDELNHRVKNTLATVQSLARQTARHAGSLQDFTSAFEARLLALARAHDMLTKRHWGHAPLSLLAAEVLAPLVGAKDRLRTDGPPIDLNPRAALSLTMTLHELATNALKHGALSKPTGTLNLVWKLRNDGDRTMLDLEWREEGGPAVTAPTRKGFGTRLIERCVERDLGGLVDLAFETEGVNCRMSFPVAEPESV